MNQHQKDFLNLVNLPARLNLQQTAWLLGFNEHEISVLVSGGKLKPLGRPPPSGSKYFATEELQALRNKEDWLKEASDFIVKYWKKKNAGRVKFEAELQPA